MGSRLSDSWFGEAINPAGDIDWQGHGVYSFKLHEGKVNIVKHIMGYEVIIHRKLHPICPKLHDHEQCMNVQFYSIST